MKADGILIEVKVRPKSDIFRFYKKGESFFIDVRSSPDKGKANTEIVKEMKKLLGKDVEIVRGLKSKNKTILIRGLESISHLEQGV